MSWRLPAGRTRATWVLLLVAFCGIDAERNDKKKRSPQGGLQIGQPAAQGVDEEDVEPGRGALVELGGKNAAFFSSQQRGKKHVQKPSEPNYGNYNGSSRLRRPSVGANDGGAPRDFFKNLSKTQRNRSVGHHRASLGHGHVYPYPYIGFDTRSAVDVPGGKAGQNYTGSNGHLAELAVRSHTGAPSRGRRRTYGHTEADMTWHEWIVEVLFAIGGGTGATIGGTGDPDLDQDMVRRMRYQDKAVMLVLLIAYTGSLIFSATLAYRQASNNSPVTYYADPRLHNMVVDSLNLDAFLDSFNQPPKDVHLQVSGFVPLQDPEMMSGNIDWYGMHYHVAFSFALDLSPWVVRGGINDYRSSYYDVSPNEVGVNQDDLNSLRDFIQLNTNDLAIVELRKTVVWHDWEELATNIKHQIRQSGFGGIISVYRNETETVHVYKNKPWANFMHSRTTKVLWALSLVGWLFYQPYMWLRCTTTHVRSFYRIDIPIHQFWPFIENKISADGFSDHDQ
eukprot:TRINITY_DN55091_c0_g1_i1.p1 TRINITY_DN55091_c0_g1~~TRINITY_DN55091_c0_g1_i1.p1  ORF type:complete len:507 (-),score=82.71 TRINITY_DN55091_c0_g1_i1:90-1610(-)